MGPSGDAGQQLEGGNWDVPGADRLKGSIYRVKGLEAAACKLLRTLGHKRNKEPP